MSSKSAQAWLFVFIYAGFIFFLSSLSKPLGDLTNLSFFQSLQKFHTDKFFHIVEYTVLGALLIRAVMESKFSESYVKLALLAFVIGVLYGYSDEWHQRFVPGRQYDLTDWLADAIGIAFGIYLHLKKRMSKRYA